MPILTQAKKAMRRDSNRAVFNVRVKREMKARIKEIRTLVAASSAKEAVEKLPLTYKAIDKAAKRNIIKKNTAARYKSRLARLIAKQG